MTAQPSWHLQAACAESGSALFYSSLPEDIAQAKSICCTCPVVGPCGAYAEAVLERHGVWGGRSEDERRSELARRRMRRDVGEQLDAAMANEGNWTVIGDYDNRYTAKERASVLRKRALPPGNWTFSSRARGDGGSELLALYSRPARAVGD